MRVRILRFLPLAGLLLFAACGDGPTLPGAGTAPNMTSVVAPDGDQQSPSCCDTLWVVAPGPEPCDPYRSLSWCQSGDQCMTSVPEDFQRLSGCPGTGGGTGGGGGALTCPTWDPDCAPGSTGGGNSGTSPDSPSPCDPFIDPNCYKPLTGADSASISAALSRYLRPLSTIQDATARQECENMVNAFNTLYTNGRVFRGAYTTIPGDPGVIPHTGAYDANLGKMHIDPRYLDRAARGDASSLRELMDTLLHESAHALYLDHPNGFVTTQWGPVYSDPYFNLLGPGANSCLVW